MKSIEADLSVGADPEKQVVIAKVRDVEGQHCVDCVLSPAQAETIGSWLRSAAGHIRGGSGRPLEGKGLQAPGCELLAIRVDAGSGMVTLTASEAQRPYLMEARLPADQADETASWFEGAAADMTAQAEGKIDLRNVRTIYPLMPKRE